MTTKLIMDLDLSSEKRVSYYSDGSTALSLNSLDEESDILELNKEETDALIKFLAEVKELEQAEEEES